MKVNAPIPFYGNDENLLIRHEVSFPKKPLLVGKGSGRSETSEVDGAYADVIEHWALRCFASVAEVHAALNQRIIELEVEMRWPSAVSLLMIRLTTAIKQCTSFVAG